MSELCLSCGVEETQHNNIHEDNAVTITMMKLVSKNLPSEYAETLDRLVLEWRTHALPTCDPLAID